MGFSLNVIGSGAARTIIDGGGFSCPAGSSITGCRVVTIFPATTATVVLSGLTIRNGSAYDNGISPCGGAGGGIDSSSTLTINNSTISRERGGATGEVDSSVWPGGGIAFSGTLIINNSTVSGNKTSVRRLGFYGPFGGGISSSSGTLVISNSTISGNTAYDGGASRAAVVQ